MEGQPNISIGIGPNWGEMDAVSPECQRAVGKLVGKLARTEDPRQCGPDITSHIGDSWELGGHEVVYSVEAAHCEGCLFWVYNTGLVLVTTLTEVPETYVVLV